VGLIAVGIGLALGVLLGLLAAARRGWVEEIIMRLADFTFAFPAMLSAIMLTAVFGAGMVNSIIAIGIFNIPTFARITRASANAVGARLRAGRRACGKAAGHHLPACAAQHPGGAGRAGHHPVRLAILAEAALSYLGLGTQPPSHPGAHAQRSADPDVPGAAAGRGPAWRSRCRCWA
jgi:peptide/nickel transport system permease protein